MSLKRIISSAVLAAGLLALAPTNADAAVAARRGAFYRPTESISFNRYQVRKTKLVKIAMFFGVICRNGHCGIIEL